MDGRNQLLDLDFLPGAKHVVDSLAIFIL